ncbi:MAG: hypothetical protein WC307_03075 [Candidatus Nanoarchaeia archaeon]|jgi:transcription initiation factor TFIIIB Brf1 subunit/transcription initiation factor TFIIB
MPDWLSYDNLMRGLGPANTILNTIVNQLLLPKHVSDYSLMIYERLIAKKLTSGRKREPLMGACIYLSCLGTNYPVDLNKLCRLLECDKKDLIRQKKFINRHVETNEEGITVESYINRYGYQLSLTPAEITNAMNNAKQFKQGLMNKTTQVKAAASIYQAVQDKVSIRRLARATGLSISAIHKAVKEVRHLMPATDLLLINKPLILLKTRKKQL